MRSPRRWRTRRRLGRLGGTGTSAAINDRSAASSSGVHTSKSLAPRRSCALIAASTASCSEPSASSPPSAEPGARGIDEPEPSCDGPDGRGLLGALPRSGGMGELGSPRGVMSTMPRNTSANTASKADKWSRFVTSVARASQYSSLVRVGDASVSVRASQPLRSGVTGTPASCNCWPNAPTTAARSSRSAPRRVVDVNPRPPSRGRAPSRRRCPRGT